MHTTIRIYQHGDHPAIAEIFFRAIHEIACDEYSPEQCHVWSGTQPNPEHWKTRCERKRPFVAVVESQITGFLELDPDGHIDCAYIHPDFKRRGIMTHLVRHAIDTAFSRNLPQVYVEASICIKPLFEREGFEVISDAGVDISGIHLQNYRMELRNPKKGKTRLQDDRQTPA